MEYQVAILSTDTVFARMLELEFSMLGLRTLSCVAMADTDSAAVVVLDLDSAEPPASCETVIGFTRNSALIKIDTHRHCSMILHRPFEVRLLRREVMAALGILEGHPVTQLVEKKREEEKEKSLRLSLDEARSLLLTEDREIALTPIEMQMMRHFLEHRGETVFKKTLTALIGDSASNKTEVYVCYLRKKTDLPNGMRLIRTVRQKGYRID